MASLDSERLRRYARQLSLPGVGARGQEKLLDASVVVVGAGGLGCPMAIYLAAAGVGHLVLVDGDRVETSNLHRQVLYGTADVGRPKVEVAAERLRALNPDVSVETRFVRLDASNVMELLGPGDVIADGSDNFPTRYLVSDACVRLGKPNAHGSIHRFEGQVAWFDARTGPCYRCLHPEPPPPGLVPSCAEAGVLGALPGVVGTLQATEVLKYLLGIGDLLEGRLLVYDALSMSIRELRLRKDPDCPACGPDASTGPLVAPTGYCTSAAGPAEATPVPPASPPSPSPPPPPPPPPPGADDDAPPPVMGPEEVAALLAGPTPPLLVDVREDWEFASGSLPGAVHIPLGTLPRRWRELPADRTVVLVCHLGIRSLDAMLYLRDRGLRRAVSMDGGTEAWFAVRNPTAAPGDGA